MSTMVARDDRASRIELAADRFAYLVVSYGLLLCVAYRSFVRDEASWDLIGLVLLGGICGLAYRARGGVVSGRSTAVLLGTTVIAAVIAGLLVLLGR